MLLFFFFFNDTATTEIYTLSLHDALPIFALPWAREVSGSYLLFAKHNTAFLAKEPILPLQQSSAWPLVLSVGPSFSDRKSTRLNSSHANISYAVFCLKKKNT